MFTDVFTDDQKQQIARNIRIAEIARLGLAPMVAADMARAAGRPVYAGKFRVHGDGRVEEAHPAGWVTLQDHDSCPTVHAAFEVALYLA